ncbi:MAG: SlyX family protein [Rubripirellula sp.]
MASEKNNADRLTELEIQLAHVQRMYEQLNDVVTTEAMRGDRIQRKVDALTVQLKEVKNKSAEPATDPLDEKPPHY